MLKQKGYATAAIGKWGLGHFGTTGDPNKQGLDLFYGFNCQRHAHNHYPRFLWRNNNRETLPGNDRTLNGKTYWEFPGYGGQQVVRIGDWKGVRQGILRRNNKSPLKIELDNLKTDLGEKSDVAGKHPDLIAKIRRTMSAARTPSKLFPIKPLDDPSSRER